MTTNAGLDLETGTIIHFYWGYNHYRNKCGGGS